MEKAKIFGILDSFSKLDVNSFSRFLESSWLNPDARIIPLFKQLMIFHAGKKTYSRKELFHSLYPGRPYQDKEMRYLLSSLTLSLKKYIAQKEIFSDPSLIYQYTLKGLASRECQKAYDYEHDRFEKQSRGEHIRNAAYYLNNFLIHYQHWNYAFRKQKRKNIIRFDDLMMELDVFYVARKLQLLAEMENAQNVLAADYTVHFSDEIKKLAQQPGFAEVPVVAVYFHVLMTITSPESEVHFVRLRHLLAKHAARFPDNELVDLYQYIRNYCIKKINTGDNSYQAVLFEIYQEILSNKKLFHTDYFSQWEFKNMTTLGLRLGHLKWVERFLRKFSYYLRPDERRNAILYNQANLFFHKKEYSAALRLLQKVEFTDVYYQLDTRSIQLKTYYEQGDEETVLFQAAAFKVFLKRNKLISSYQRMLYRNLVKFTGGLVHAGNSKKKLTALLHRLDQTPQVADSQWVRQKINELLD